MHNIDTKPFIKYVPLYPDQENCIVTEIYRRIDPYKFDLAEAVSRYRTLTIKLIHIFAQASFLFTMCGICGFH